MQYTCLFAWLMQAFMHTQTHTCRFPGWLGKYTYAWRYLGYHGMWHINPFVYESPHKSAPGLIFFITLCAMKPLTKSLLFILLQQGESNQRMHDWLALSPCDYLHFIQSGRCTGTKSSACYSHLLLSSSPQPSHIALICTVTFCGITFSCVRVHISPQILKSICVWKQSTVNTLNAEDSPCHLNHNFPGWQSVYNISNLH